MVLKGQFLERATLVPVGKRTLEGLWHRGSQEPCVLLCPPLPGEGSMDAAALNELAYALSRAGRATLRFNHSGVGASPVRAGKDPSAEPELEARAAAALLRESAGVQKLAVLGYRSGAHTALSLLDLASAVILVAPPADLKLEPIRLAPIPAQFLIAEADPLRRQWGNHCATTGDTLTVIPAADLQFLRGLPQLGRAVVEFIESLGL